MQPTAPHLLPPARQVDCRCDPFMQRAVLHDQSGWNVRVTACMRCGTVTATRSLIEEPRPHDVRCVGNEVIPLAPDALAWLAQWPRRMGATWGSPLWHFIPHELLFNSPDELHALEARMGASATRSGPSGTPPLGIDRLRAAGTPPSPAPDSLPSELSSFRAYHDALALPRDASSEALVRAMARAPIVTGLLGDWLASLPQVDAVLAEALRSHEPERRRVASIVLTSSPALVGPRVLDALRAMLDAVRSETDEGAPVLYTVSALGPRASTLVPALESLRDRLDPQREYYFHKSAVQAIARLRG